MSTWVYVPFPTLLPRYHTDPSGLHRLKKKDSERRTSGCTLRRWRRNKLLKQRVKHQIRKPMPASIGVGSRTLSTLSY